MSVEEKSEIIKREVNEIENRMADLKSVIRSPKTSITEDSESDVGLPPNTRVGGVIKTQDITLRKINQIHGHITDIEDVVLGHIDYSDGSDN